MLLMVLRHMLVCLCLNDRYPYRDPRLSLNPTHLFGDPQKTNRHNIAVSATPDSFVYMRTPQTSEVGWTK